MEIKAYVVEEQGNEQVTDHFKVKEFACKDGTPIVFIDDYLAVILEIARKKINKPIVITSGYRTVSHNKKESKGIRERTQRNLQSVQG